jgi:hypothetical protein
LTGKFRRNPSHDNHIFYQREDRPEENHYLIDLYHLNANNQTRSRRQEQTGELKEPLINSMNNGRVRRAHRK